MNEILLQFIQGKLVDTLENEIESKILLLSASNNLNCNQNVSTIKRKYKRAASP